MDDVRSGATHPGRCPDCGRMHCSQVCSTTARGFPQPSVGIIAKAQVIKGALPASALKEAFSIADYLDEHRPNKRWGQTRDRARMDNRRGIVAELCLMHAYGMPLFTSETYPGFEQRGEADVGDHVEVRSTEHPRGRLLLHEGHDDIDPKIGRDYVLVILNKTWGYTLAGWLPMRECVTAWKAFTLAQRPCQSVDQYDLRAMTTLDITWRGTTYRIASKDLAPSVTSFRWD